MMTDKTDSKSGGSNRLDGVMTLDIVAIEEGATVRLVDGETAEVVDNPRDGSWILLRYTDVPDDPSQVGEEALIFWTDVLGVVNGEEAAK